MRKIVNNNYANVTCEFAYSAGTGYAVAYTGATNERIWMPAVSFAGCKSRDEAELKTLLYLMLGNKEKSLYGGFNKNARLQLIGFDAFEKGVYRQHKQNVEEWKKVLHLLSAGKDGLRFDLLSINDTCSKAIENASGYRWKALNRAEHAANFAAMVTNTKKAAKARPAATAKVETESRAVAKTEPAPAASAKSALQAKVEKAMAATETGLTLDEILEGVA